jgi:hypothetical protein
MKAPAIGRCIRSARSRPMRRAGSPCSNRRDHSAHRRAPCGPAAGGCGRPGAGDQLDVRGAEHGGAADRRTLSWPVLWSMTSPGMRNACRCSTPASGSGSNDLSGRLGEADWLDGGFSRRRSADGDGAAPAGEVGLAEGIPRTSRPISPGRRRARPIGGRSPPSWKSSPVPCHNLLPLSREKRGPPRSGGRMRVFFLLFFFARPAKSGSGAGVGLTPARNPD